MTQRGEWKAAYRDDRAVLYLGDALEVLPHLDPVDAIVTSPPYADQRKYGGSTPSDYAEWLGPFLAAMLPALKPSGSLMLNIGRVARDGVEVPCAFDALYAARALGWKLLDTIIWLKPNSLPWSSTAYLHSVHEYVFWLAPSTDAYRGFTTETRGEHAESSLARWGQGYRRTSDERYHKRGKVIAAPHPDGSRPKTVFEAAIGTVRGLKHTAPMAPALARHLVALACPVGGTVLDPFAGSGTTLIAAKESGRSAVGIELAPESVTEASERLALVTWQPPLLEVPA